MGSGLDIDIEAVQKEIQYWREWCDRQGCKNLEPILELAEQRLNTVLEKLLKNETELRQKYGAIDSSEIVALAYETYLCHSVSEHGWHQARLQVTPRGTARGGPARP